MPRLDHRRRPQELLHPLEAKPERLLQWMLQELNTLRSVLDLSPLVWEDVQTSLRHPHEKSRSPAAGEGEIPWRS